MRKLPACMGAAFAAVWFGTMAVDSAFPPAEPVFNAALAILAALSVLGHYFDRG